VLVSRTKTDQLSVVPNAKGAKKRSAKIPASNRESGEMAGTD
jgi:hypothetical protein